MPDAAGIAAYQLNQFLSANAAEFFLDSTLRGRTPDGSVMFWALTWQPTADAATEPLVLIRDTNKSIIYPFSFSDIDSAFEFVRHEMQRGLDLSQVMIYWAVPAHIEIDFWGRSAIQPAEAPLRLTAISKSIAEPVSRREVAVETVMRPITVTEGEGDRYLAEDDIAETVRQAEQAASKSPPPDVPDVDGRVVPMPVPGPSPRKSKRQKTTEDATPIDFPSASQKIQEGRLARAAVTAWGNFSLAVDEALDIYVARQVATKLVWNRIMRALSQAVDAQQRADADAAERTASLEAARTEAVAKKAARCRGLAIAWLNVAWALEEAGFAYALERKSRAIRAWRFATLGIAEATEAHVAHEKALQLIRVRAGLSNLSIAIEEAMEANAYREELIEAWNALIGGILSAADAKQYCDRAIAAWGNVAFALEGVCRVNVTKQKKAVRAWRPITKALNLALTAKLERDAAIAAWLNISLALEESVTARQRHEGLLAAWASASVNVAEAVVAKRVYETAVTSWANASVALEEAAVAWAWHEFLVEAWENAGDALEAAAKALLARQAGLELAWDRLTVALDDAFRARIARDTAIAVWANGSLAIGEMLHAFLVRRTLIWFWRNAGRAFGEAVPVHLFKQQSIVAWTTASISIKEALVADALLRIKQARLDQKHMTGVEKAVKTTVARARTKTAKAARGEKTATIAIVVEEVEVGVALAPPPLMIGDVKMPEEFLPDEVAEEPIAETMPPLEGEFAQALLAAVDAVNLDDDEEPFDEETPEEQVRAPLFPGLWRSHDADRWQPREAPFKSFESPPGRF